MAVDAIYAAYHSEKMSAPDVIFRGIKESGATQGIVFGGRALRLEKCFRKYFNDKRVELIERIKAIIDADKRVSPMLLLVLIIENYLQHIAKLC